MSRRFCVQQLYGVIDLGQSSDEQLLAECGEGASISFLFHGRSLVVDTSTCAISRADARFEEPCEGHSHSHIQELVGQRRLSRCMCGLVAKMKCIIDADDKELRRPQAAIVADNCYQQCSAS